MVLTLIAIGIFLLLTLCTWLATKVFPRLPFSWRYPCKLYICLLFLVIGIYGHLIQPQSVVSLMPSWIPLRLFITYVTGILELAFVVLLWTRFQIQTAWVILVYLVLTIPFNIYGWTLTNNSPNYLDDPYYLWFRVPFQLVLALLTFYGVYGRLPLAGRVNSL